MTTFIFHFHSGLRWVILLGVLISLVRMAMIWLQNGQFRSFDKTLSIVTTSLFDIQLVVGIVLLYLMTNGFAVLPRHQLEHVFTMFLAVIAVHVPMKWKTRPDPIRAKATVIALLVALTLIIAGIARLPQGWHF